MTSRGARKSNALWDWHQIRPRLLAWGFLFQALGDGQRALHGVLWRAIRMALQQRRACSSVVRTLGS